MSCQHFYRKHVALFQLCIDVCICIRIIVSITFSISCYMVYYFSKGLCLEIWMIS